jgi:hypothetical protein
MPPAPSFAGRAGSDELAALRNEVAQLRSELEELTSRFAHDHDDLERLKTQLGV